MKILKKSFLFLVAAGVVMANSYHTSASTSLPEKKVVMVHKSIKGTLTGWADSHSFEANTTRHYMVFQTNNHWYYTHLKIGQHYTFYYVSNQYGQNIITKINK